MIYLVSIVHALACLFIVIFILLQDPKGGVLGSLGGGGASKSFFGSEGASPFLVNVTKWLAIIFACTSFYLSYVSSQKDSSLMAPDSSQELEIPPPSSPPSPLKQEEDATSPSSLKEKGAATSPPSSLKEEGAATSPPSSSLKEEGAATSPPSANKGSEAEPSPSPPPAKPDKPQAEPPAEPQGASPDKP